MSTQDERRAAEAADCTRCAGLGELAGGEYPCERCSGSGIEPEWADVVTSSGSAGTADGGRDEEDEHFPWHYTEFGVVCCCGMPCRADESCTSRPPVPVSVEQGGDSSG